MDTDLPFDFGDTVRLKIGGPLMTVVAVGEDQCGCVWFSDRNELEHGKFELGVVELVEPLVRLIEVDRVPWRHRRRRTSRSSSGAAAA
jgi:uncharacterized protein YodC (DUF2158 family)